jgi:hypothetical protein
MVFGPVNANRRHHEQAADALARADGEWLDGLITRRVPLAEFPDALNRRPGRRQGRTGSGGVTCPVTHGCCWSTTTSGSRWHSGSPLADEGCEVVEAASGRGGARGAGGHRRWTSCCWTSCCPAWTAWRSAGSCGDAVICRSSPRGISSWAAGGRSRIRDVAVRGRKPPRVSDAMPPRGRRITFARISASAILTCSATD